jgi:hypothetical protein
MGAIARQGPHQTAQKSTKTGIDACNTSVSNVESFTSIGCDIILFLFY